MKRIMVAPLVPVVAFFVLIAGCGTAGKNNSAGKNNDQLINAKEAERIISVLAADDMKGRKAFTPEIDKAADFIAKEFKDAGLETWNNTGSYLQSFAVYNPVQKNAVVTFDGTTLDPQNAVVITTEAELKIDQSSGYEVATIGAGGNLFQKAYQLMDGKKDRIVIVDTSFSKTFSRLSSFKRNLFPGSRNTVFVLATAAPSTFSVQAVHDVKEQRLTNVVGILPGKSKKDEYVIFSGHYDHIGIGKPVDGDSIYNGANDDAAGTTAVILLAKYFKALNNNERTIIFAAFTAEEIGGYGSRYFSQQFEPAKVMAMFNIEMIGTDSKWGKNSAYITGYERTNMGEILQKNLEGTGFTFHPDPYPDQQLFFRSDNATLAALGVPAHTISTSKMDNEPNYHKPSDHVATLDMDNMAMIIKSIALSSRTIVAGTDTPSRVDVSGLTR